MNLTGVLTGIDQTFSGDLGVFARRLDTKETIAYRAAEPNPPASAIKALILTEVFRQASEGRFRLTDPNRVVKENVERTYGSGVLRDLTLGLTLSIEDMCVLMMTLSDNVATNQMIQLVGLDAINQMAKRLGMKNTWINRPMIHVGEEAQIPFGQTCALDFGILFEALYRGEVVNPKSSQRMLDIMLSNHFKTDILRYLPPDLIRPESPASDPIVRVASKSGTTTGVKCSAGVVYTPHFDYVIALFSRNCTDRLSVVDEECADRPPTVDNENQVVLPRVSRLIFDTFAFGTWEPGATNAAQRTFASPPKG